MAALILYSTYCMIVAAALMAELGSSAYMSRGKFSPHRFQIGPWRPATATWYGSPTGAGTDGGACGYGSLPRSPYGSIVSAGSPVLFRNGQGCGACYQVKCMIGFICSKYPVTVTITDECPGGICGGGRTHFDMSGSAFGRMASGLQKISKLLDTGVVNVMYRRVPCNYRATKLAFQVNEGANNFWFSMLVKYQNGDGDLSRVELKEGQYGKWKSMQHLWGAYWCLTQGPLKPPFSIRVTSSSGDKLTMPYVIPRNWLPGKTYFSRVNFP